MPMIQGNPLHGENAFADRRKVFKHDICFDAFANQRFIVFAYTFHLDGNAVACHRICAGKSLCSHLLFHRT